MSTVASEAQAPRAFPPVHDARESLGAAAAKSLTRVMLGWFLVAWLNAGNLLPRHMLYTPLAAWYYFTGPGRFSLDAMLAGRKEAV